MLVSRWRLGEELVVGMDSSEVVMCCSQFAWASCQSRGKKFCVPCARVV